MMPLFQTTIDYELSLFNGGDFTFWLWPILRVLLIFENRMHYNFSVFNCIKNGE